MEDPYLNLDAHSKMNQKNPTPKILEFTKHTGRYPNLDAMVWYLGYLIPNNTYTSYTVPSK